VNVVFCGGGTGGHVYPALAVASALQNDAEFWLPTGVLYVGVRGRIDRDIVTRAGIAFRDVTAGPVRSPSPVGTARGVGKLMLGVLESLRILKGFSPDVVFATGGYGSVGVGIAAWLRRIPMLLFLPDAEPGLAVRTLVRFATRIAVTVPPARASMPTGRTVLTGYPVRSEFFGLQQERARGQLGLHPTLPTLLVSGASSGANRINTAVTRWLADFLRVGQLVHISGQADEPWLRKQRDELPPNLQERYHLHAYLHDDMPQALAAADVAVMRSGASVLGELPAVGLPAILIPGEYEGWDQSPNARYLESEGAAVMLPQSQTDDLQAVVMSLLADTQRRGKMKEALSRLARPDAAQRLAEQLQQIARGARVPTISGRAPG
jgi:UDP-N-acetylglucosamine--N-acetylmuramyl-(pentapeptide) pyrophosphoryl-undecaprenol N-acetylglucosamine transferase